MRLEHGTYRVDRGTRNRAWRTPKELWGFRKRVGRGDPADTARVFLRENADILGIGDVLGKLEQRAVLSGLGATHVIFQQKHAGVRVHRGFVTVHIARNHDIYLVKSRATPKPHLPRDTRFVRSAADAAVRAVRYLRAEGVAGEVNETSHLEKRWFFYDGGLRPAWRVRVHTYRPRQEWIIYVDARTSRVLSEWDNLALARGYVFDPHPLIETSWRQLYDRETGAIGRPTRSAYQTRTLERLKRGPVLDGERVSTALTRDRVRKRDRDFRFTCGDTGFLEVMAYYHLDRVIGYLESLGYRNERRLFTEPIQVDVAWGDEDNSHFDPVAKSLHFGTGGVPDAQDADVILHEFGHALQDAICPDFGQSFHAAAIGEGFSDYLAASVLADRKPGYEKLVMSWSALPWEDYAWKGQPKPFLRRLDSELTLAKFRSRPGCEYDNGAIWSALLWQIREALGQRVADEIIIDSHFQLDGFTSTRRAARAIVDADVNLFRARHAAQLRRIFEARSIRWKDVAPLFLEDA